MHTWGALLKVVPATVQEMSQEKKKSQDHLLSGNWLGQRWGRDGSSTLSINKDVRAGNFAGYLLN